jgi:hypothetical protein
MALHEYFTASPAIGRLLAGWSHLYRHTAVNTAVTYLHLVGIMVGGGVAVTADRASLRLSPATPDWSAELARLAGVHRWVLTGLGLIFATGSLMALADLDGVMRSVVFWVKMGLVGLLLANGYLRMRSETALRQGGGASNAWTGFRRSSAASLALWFAVLLAGALLHSTL